MIHYNEYDKSIIVSGDGDFYCLIEYLESKNKLLRLIVPNQKYSALLRKYNNFIVRVDMLKKLLLTKKDQDQRSV